jgi:hypothetical protein
MGGSTAAAKRRELLSDDLGGVRLAQRSRTGNGEGHAPEVRIGSDEFDTDIGLAIALAADGHDVAFDRAVAAFIHKLEGLARNDNLVQQEQPAIAVDGLRRSLCGELLSIVGLSMNCDWHGETDPQCAASFFAAEVENSHGNYLPQIKIKNSAALFERKTATAAILACVGKAQAHTEEELTTPGKVHWYSALPRYCRQ